MIANFLFLTCLFFIVGRYVILLISKRSVKHYKDFFQFIPWSVDCFKEALNQFPIKFEDLENGSSKHLEKSVFNYLKSQTNQSAKKDLSNCLNKKISFNKPIQRVAFKVFLEDQILRPIDQRREFYHIYNFVQDHPFLKTFILVVGTSQTQEALLNFKDSLEKIGVNWQFTFLPEVPESNFFWKSV